MAGHLQWCEHCPTLLVQMSVLQRSIVGPLLPGTVHHALLPTGVLLYGPPGKSN
jgi:ATP-dependent 26S proteasome regulatory subunit